MWKAILIGLLAVLLTACNAPFVARPGTPTPTPSSTPTIPPLPTPTNTPTLIPLTLPVTAALDVAGTATAKASTRPELDCKVLQQSFQNGSKFVSKGRFDISWAIQNTGTATWEPGVVELAYAGGSKMYQYQPVRLTHSSPPGDIITISAVMVAPHTPDRYSMVWALRRGDEYFCKIKVTISVHL
jgi:hypothetical protein